MWWWSWLLLLGLRTGAVWSLLPAEEDDCRETAKRLPASVTHFACQHSISSWFSQAKAIVMWQLNIRQRIAWHLIFVLSGPGLHYVTVEYSSEDYGNLILVLSGPGRQYVTVAYSSEDHMVSHLHSLRPRPSLCDCWIFIRVLRESHLRTLRPRPSLCHCWIFIRGLHGISSWYSQTQAFIMWLLNIHQMITWHLILVLSGPSRHYVAVEYSSEVLRRIARVASNT